MIGLKGKEGRGMKRGLLNSFTPFRFAKQFFIQSTFILENVIGVKYVVTGHIPSNPVCFPQKPHLRSASCFLTRVA